MKIRNLREIPATALLLALAFSASACIQVVMPGDGAVVLGNSAHVLVEECTGTRPMFTTTLDGRPEHTAWHVGSYPDQWVADLPLPSEGAHRLVLSGFCGDISGTLTRDFSSRLTATPEPAEKLAMHFMNAHPARKLGWDWAEAVFLYGLGRLGTHADYLRAYEGHWLQKGIPAPDRSDLCPSALGSVELAKQGDWSTFANAERVARYIRTEPRDRLGALNHLGHSLIHLVFPDSIWVDSLMMIGVFSAQYGRLTGDAALLEFAAAQPGIYASVLQDRESGLFRHAWVAHNGSTMPSAPLFWLRGNAWVLASIVDILEELPAEDPHRAQLVGLLQSVARGFARYQLEDGSWDTLVNQPGQGYAEKPGTVLASYALARGVHRGWLGPEYLARAHRAFKYVTELLVSRPDGYSLPRNSGPTSPMYTARDYDSVGIEDDAPYGVGAYLMAAREQSGEVF